MLVLDALDSVVGALRASAAELNELDSRAGDGDLGVTAVRLASALASRREEFNGSDISAALRASGEIVAREAPSTSGTLLAIGLTAASTVEALSEAAPSEQCALVLSHCAEAIEEAGGATPGSRTMLDALVPGAEAAASAAQNGCDLPAVLDAAAMAAEAGARATADMVPEFGRASWLSDKAIGVEDGGARLIAVLLHALAAAARPAGD